MLFVIMFYCQLLNICHAYINIVRDQPNLHFHGHPLFCEIYSSYLEMYICVDFHEIHRFCWNFNM